MKTLTYNTIQYNTIAYSLTIRLASFCDTDLSSALFAWRTVNNLVKALEELTVAIWRPTGTRSQDMESEGEIVAPILLI